MNWHFTNGLIPKVVTLIVCVFTFHQVSAESTAGSFSIPEPVTTGALQMVRLFPEPLIPLGSVPTDAENAALAAVLPSFAQSRDMATLAAFVEANPASPWRASVLVNLGLLQFDAGYYSRSLLKNPC